MAAKPKTKVPLLLLKTRSTPTDAYEECFSALDNGWYEPIFVPVLEHKFKEAALRQVQQHILDGDFTSSGPGSKPKYGAMVFTSQRAVEAFAQVIEGLRQENPYLLASQLPQNMPLYVVGPATARGLKALNLQCPVIGEDTGNGEALAAFILQHYNDLYKESPKAHILFLVGEKRRDIIPKTLQSKELAPAKRSVVHELEIYETGEMQSFQSNFTSIWRRNLDANIALQWIVVFSPTGCRAMLASLGLLDVGTGKAVSKSTSRSILIATIGPTTRDYLIQEFGFTPDVCASKPSPEGILSAIQSFTLP